MTAAASKHLVERFYHEVWNKNDEQAAYAILSSDLRFRGSLGEVRVGHEGFLDYMRSIHRALGDYTCIIEDLIVADDRAAARMVFTGKHKGLFLDMSPTGRTVRWAGAAFFETNQNLIASAWVLGDMESIRQQLT